jgi:hypothetical protein
MSCARNGALAVLLPVLGLPLAFAQSTTLDADILGKWRIVDHVSPPGATSSLSEQDVRRLIGKLVVVETDRLEFNGHRCSQPDYKRRIDDAVDYFYREWRLNANEMPIGKRVTVVENRCGDNVLYPTIKGNMIIAEDGFFFEAVRIEKNSSSPSAPVGANGAQGANADIFGTWTIDGADWKGSGYDSAATKKKKAAVYMGMPVHISAGQFLYNQNSCKQPAYKRYTTAKSDYFHGDWRADQGRLPLPDRLTVIETGCGRIYPINKQRILIEDRRGMFFSAVALAEESAN